jgi:hypothetical protein
MGDVRFVHSVVCERTTIGDRYRASAAWQSMDAYLVDWKMAYERLGRQIAELEAMRDQRKADKEAGVWPPDVVVQVSAEDRVTGLMEALEQSVNAAKAERDRLRAATKNCSNQGGES